MIPGAIKNRIVGTIAKVEIILKMENINLRKFSQFKMTVFPNLSAKLRIKIIWMQMMFEKASLIILVPLG